MNDDYIAADTAGWTEDKDIWLQKHKWFGDEYDFVYDEEIENNAAFFMMYPAAFIEERDKILFTRTKTVDTIEEAREFLKDRIYGLFMIAIE